MKQINLGEILKKHLANYNDNGDAIPFIIEAMKDACDEALDMAADEARVIQL